MKTSTKGIISTMNEKEMKELLSETKETIATGILKNNKTKRTFAVVDLWNMQKKHKTLGSSTKW